MELLLKGKVQKLGTTFGVIKSNDYKELHFFILSDIIDNDKTKIKEIIKKTQNKNYTALTNWTKENPKFMNDDSKQMYYAKAMSQCGKTIDDGIDEKIIKQVCKQTYVKNDLNMIE